MHMFTHAHFLHSLLQEVDSVFRNIRIVERCLGEVGGVVATCRGRGGEEVDYEGDSESEGTGNGMCGTLPQ